MFKWLDRLGYEMAKAAMLEFEMDYNGNDSEYARLLRERHREALAEWEDITR